MPIPHSIKKSSHSTLKWNITHFWIITFSFASRINERKEAYYRLRFNPQSTQWARMMMMMIIIIIMWAYIALQLGNKSRCFHIFTHSTNTRTRIPVEPPKRQTIETHWMHACKITVMVFKTSEGFTIQEDQQNPFPYSISPILLSCIFLLHKQCEYFYVEHIIMGTRKSLKWQRWWLSPLKNSFHDLQMVEISEYVGMNI